jgi:hypothetical protein
MANGDERDPPGYAERGQVSRSVVNPLPGQATSGFVLVTPAPPTNIRFFAEQFDTLREGEGDDLAEPTMFDYGVSGVIVGPDTSRSPSVRRMHRDSCLRFESESVTPRGGASVSVLVHRACNLTLGVFDSRGRRVRVLRTGRFEEGAWGEVWNGLDDKGSPVTPGTYSFRLFAGGKELDSVSVVVPD